MLSNEIYYSYYSDILETNFFFPSPIKRINCYEKKNWTEAFYNEILHTVQTNLEVIKNLKRLVFFSSDSLIFFFF